MHILPRHLHEVFSKIPNTEFQLTTERTFEIIKSVKSGAVDLGIVMMEPRDSEILSKHIGFYDMVLAVPKNHPLLNRTKLTLKEIAQYPFISYSSGLEIRRLIEKPFKKQGLKLNSRISFGSTDLLLRYASLGHGITIVHNLSSERGVIKGVSMRSLASYFDRQGLFVISSKSAKLNEAADMLISLLS